MTVATLPVRPAQRPHRLSRTFQNAALTLSAVMFLAVAGGTLLGRYRTVTMLTGSMRPGIPAGSLVLLDRTPVEELKPGDVVTFEAPLADKRVVTHRLVEVRRDASGTSIRTKGDANESADPWTAVIQDREVWRVRAAVPRLGSVLLLAQGRNARRALWYGVPAALLLAGLFVVWRPRRA